MEEIKFNSEELEKVEYHKSKYPDSKSAIMPILWMAQHKWGWLSKEVMEYVAELLNLPYSHVYGVSTFYTMYFKKPMGKHHVQICTNVSCMLRKGDEIFEHVSNKLNIKHNEATSDNLISLEEVECMGACGGAPMMAINEEFFENVDIKQVEELINNLK